MDGVQRDDRREQRGAAGAALHEIAGVDALVRDAAGERRADLRPFEVELRALQVGFRRRLSGAGHGEVGAPRIDVARRDGLVAGQAFRALDLVFRERDLSTGPLHFRRRGFDGEFVGPLVDREEQIALPDDLTVAEMDLIDEAGDAGAHLDLRHGLEAAGVFIPLHDPLGDRLGDDDRRRRRRSALRKALACPILQRNGNKNSKNLADSGHECLLAHSCWQAPVRETIPIVSRAAIAFGLPESAKKTRVP